MPTDVLSSVPVKTKTAGDVVININQATPGTTNGVVINSAIPTGANVIGQVGMPLSGSSDAQTAGANQVVGLAGYNGSTWDRLQVDASKYLKVNVAAGTVSVSWPLPGNADGATAATQQAAAMSGYNGTTFDRIRSYAANADAVTSPTLGNIGVTGFSYGYNGTSWDRLQVDASKYLKVNVSAALPTGANTIGAVTQASGPWTQNLTQVNSVALGSPTAIGTAATGNILTIQGNASGIPIPTSGSISSLPADVTATGSLTTSATNVTIVPTVDGTVHVGITGTWVGTISFTASTDGTNYYAITGVAIGGTGALVSSTTTNGNWRFTAPALADFKVSTTGLSSGTAVVYVRASQQNAAVALVEPLPAGTNLIGSVNAPLSGSADGQTAAGGQAVGNAGFNGTTWDRLRSYSGAADTVTSPTLGLMGVSAYNMGYNGTTWDRLRSDTNKYLYVTVGTALPAGANLLGKVGIDQTTVGTTNAIALNTIGTTTLGAPTAPGTSSSGNILTIQGNASGVPIPVSGSFSVSPGTLKNSGQQISSTTIGAGSSLAIPAGTLVTTGKVGTLQHAVFASSVPCRWDVQTINASNVATIIFSVFTSATNLSYEWKCQNAAELATVSGDGSHVQFQVTANNEDNTNAASAYASFFWAEN
jgi:hypothetical protein